MKRAAIWWQLMRGDRPIGFLLLLWGMLWALWLAADGLPPLGTLAIFGGGCFLMRSAGCVLNDLADRKIDRHVQRTRDRPLAAGRASPYEALLLATVLLASAGGLVLLTNRNTVLLACGAALLAASYPFFKRIFDAPQLILGIAFAWAVPMSFTALAVPLAAGGWWLFAAVLLWTIAYDTEYAMVDRADDRRIGVRSTARLFGRADRAVVALLQCIVLALLWHCGQWFELGWWYRLGLLGAALLFGYQQWLIRKRHEADCFRAFLNNGWVGAMIFAGIALDISLRR